MEGVVQAGVGYDVFLLCPERALAAFERAARMGSAIGAYNAGLIHAENGDIVWLLQKTLLNIEGLGRQLYPDLDLWSTAQPYLERWMRERMMPQHQARVLHQQLEQIPPLLTSTRRAMDRLAQQEREPIDTPRDSNRALRVVGVALVILGASGLGTDLNVWTQAQPLHWLLVAAGGWLVLHRR